MTNVFICVFTLPGIYFTLYGLKFTPPGKFAWLRLRLRVSLYRGIAVSVFSSGQKTPAIGYRIEPASEYNRNKMFIDVGVMPRPI